MAKCCVCGKRFKVSDAREEYIEEFGMDIDYDDQCGGEACGKCAISETNSNMNVGKAIDMMNGEEDYDEEHVTKYL